MTAPAAARGAQPEEPAHPGAPGWGELPDRAEFWRWVADAVRPLLGWVLTGAGLLSLLVTWYEVSGTAVVAEQLPYLASGGTIGLALVVLGGRAFLIEDLRRDSGRLERLERQISELHAVLLARADAPDPAAAAPPASRNPMRLAVLPGGSTAHRGDCPLVVGKEPEWLTRTAARRRGLDPCAVCEPFPESA